MNKLVRYIPLFVLICLVIGLLLNRPSSTEDKLIKGTVAYNDTKCISDNKLVCTIGISTSDEFIHLTYQGQYCPLISRDALRFKGIIDKHIYQAKVGDLVEAFVSLREDGVAYFCSMNYPKYYLKLIR